MHRPRRRWTAPLRPTVLPLLLPLLLSQGGSRRVVDTGAYTTQPRRRGGKLRVYGLGHLA